MRPKIKISNVMHRIETIDELKTEKEKIEAVMKIAEIATDASNNVLVNSTPLSSMALQKIYIVLVKKLEFSLSRNSLGEAVLASLKIVSSIEKADVMAKTIVFLKPISFRLYGTEMVETISRQLADIALNSKTENRLAKTQVIDGVAQILIRCSCRKGLFAVHEIFDEFIVIAESMHAPDKDDNDMIKRNLIHSLAILIRFGCLKLESSFEAFQKLGGITAQIKNEKIRAQAIGDLEEAYSLLIRNLSAEKAIPLNFDKAITLIERFAASITNGTDAKTSAEDSVILMRMAFHVMQHTSFINGDEDATTKNQKHSANLTVLRSLVGEAWKIGGDAGKVKSIGILTHHSLSLSQDGDMECFTAQVAMIQTIQHEKKRVEGMDHLRTGRRYEGFKPEDLDTAVGMMKNLADSFSDEDAKMIAEGAYSIIYVIHSLCSRERTGSSLAQLVRTNTVLFKNTITYPEIIWLLASAIYNLGDHQEKDEPFRSLLSEFATEVTDDNLKCECIKNLAPYIDTISPYQDALFFLQKITDTIKDEGLRNSAMRSIRAAEELLPDAEEEDDASDPESEDDPVSPE